MKIEKEIHDFLCVYDIKLLMYHYSFTMGKLSSYKDRQSLLHSSGAVYHLTSCVVKIIFGKPYAISLLASINIERVKILKFANITCIILITKLIMTQPKHLTKAVVLERGRGAGGLCPPALLPGGQGGSTAR